MNLKAILEKLKKGEALTAEEKALVSANQELLSDEQKALFAKANESEDSEIDEKSVRELVEKSISEAIAGKVEAATDTLVKTFISKAKEQMGRDKGLNTETKQQFTATREFVKALVYGDKEKLKALSTSSSDDAKAGYLVPTELVTEVYRIAETQYGIARRDMFYLPFTGPGNTRDIPNLASSVTVYWTNEKQAKRSSTPSFGLLTQTLKKLAVIIPMSEEILEDSAINLTSLLAQLVAEAISKEEDDQFLAGTGTPWTGVLNNASVNIVTLAAGVHFDEITADNLLDLQDAVPTAALAGSKYYLHRTMLTVLRKLKDTNTGAYIFQGPTGGQPGTIWNYPYELSDSMPAKADYALSTPFIMFGNLKKACILGDKQQLQVKLLDQATITDDDDETVINLAEQDMLAMRFVERVGYLTVLPKAVAVLKTNASES